MVNRGPARVVPAGQRLSCAVVCPTAVERYPRTRKRQKATLFACRGAKATRQFPSETEITKRKMNDFCVKKSSFKNQADRQKSAKLAMA